MKYLELSYVIKLHEKMIAKTGGSSGIRDIALLESALENAKSTFHGIDLYPTVEEKCASICFSIINNHPFIDGNKRMGIFILLFLGEINGLQFQYTQQNLVELGQGIAAGSIKKTDLIDWMHKHKIK